MADARNDKTIKKDENETAIKNPNRDRARGDRDRSKGGT